MAKSVWLLVSLFFVLVQHTFAAEITVVPGKSNDYALIFIVGEITKLDGEKFENIAIRTAHGGGVLNSPGGSVLAGINIGKVIQLRGYDTAVPEGATCASACGFIWLAGTKRFVFPDARIGFHSAYQFVVWKIKG